MRRVADFMAFAREHHLDCAVFPGFVLGSPHGPVVPFDAVLDDKAVLALAGPGLVLYPHFVNMDATAGGFVPFAKRHRQVGREDRFRRLNQRLLLDRPVW